MNYSNSIVAVLAALRKAQKEFPEVVRDTTNPHFHSKYATLDGVIGTLRPTLDANGLFIIQPAVCDAERGYTGVTTFLFHESGEYISETLLLPNAAPGGDKGGAQSACSAVTYARRTSYLAILGVAPADDDDGNTANGQSTRPQQSRPASKPAPKPVAAAKPNPTPAAATKQTTSVPSAAIPSTPAATIPVATAAGTISTDLPTESDTADYSKKILALSEQLHEKGGLKKSDSLPIQRKILVFLSSITGEKDIKKTTRAQWENFFARIDTAKTRENGWVKLAEWVDKANGVTKDSK